MKNPAKQEGRIEEHVFVEVGVDQAAFEFDYGLGKSVFHVPTGRRLVVEAVDLGSDRHNIALLFDMPNNVSVFIGV